MDFRAYNIKQKPAREKKSQKHEKNTCRKEQEEQKWAQEESREGKAKSAEAIFTRGQELCYSIVEAYSRFSVGSAIEAAARAYGQGFFKDQGFNIKRGRVV